MNLRDQLAAIREDEGVLTPAVVVAAAKPKTHPLHSRFEWDDKIAGPQYRLVQARELIRQVRVVYDGSDGPTKVPAFLSVRRDDDTSREYVPSDEVFQDEFATQLILRDMFREWQAFRRRYEHLKEFASLVGGAGGEGGGDRKAG